MIFYIMTGLAAFAILSLVALFIFLGIKHGWKKTIIVFLQFFGLVLLLFVMDRIGRKAGVNMDAVWDALKELGD